MIKLFRKKKDETVVNGEVPIPPTPPGVQTDIKQEKPVIENTELKSEPTTNQIPAEKNSTGDEVNSQENKANPQLEKTNQESPLIKDENQVNSEDAKDTEISEPKKINLPDELLRPQQPFTVSKYKMPEQPIDPRDRFDDLIGNPEPIDMPRAEDFTTNNKSSSFELPSADDLRKLIKASEVKPNNEIMDLPSEELHEELAPLRTMPQIETYELPETFHQDIPNAESSMADLPPSLDFKLYVSINDYAYAKNELKSMHRFFKQVDNELEKWGNPNNEKLMAELIIDLNDAQEKIIKIDEKLFEGGL